MRAIISLILLNLLVADALSFQVSTKPTDDVAKMTQRIDQLIDEQLKRTGWSAAEECSETSFVRRAYLDLTGSPPKATEVTDFLDDKSPDKRSALIQRLLRTPGHAEHLASIWTAWLTPERDDVPNLGGGQNGLQTWLRSRFIENLRYDRLVADMLVATGPTTSGPTSFFVSLENKPEKIATQTARIFMGVQLDCAQCHDHPFDQWKQRDFWGFAAYFAQISGNPEMAMRGVEVNDSPTGEVTLPNSEEVIAPKPLVDTKLTGTERGTRRQQLTLWLTTRDNPFLARATVNRVWALLMGRGLVEPVDDMRAEHPASHPEILAELSEFFAASGYDLRKLFIAITNTRAYSRSTLHPSGLIPVASYAAMTTKPLTERQLANSVGEVARQIGDQNQAMQQQLIRQLGKLRGEAGQSKLGIVNALVTLHGDLVNQASSDQSSRLLKALQAPHLDHRGQIRWMFLTVLGRSPTAKEEQFLSTSLAEIRNRPRHESSTPASSKPASNQADSESSDAASKNEQPNSKQEAIATDNDKSLAAEELQWQSDLLWALLNSSEFAMTP